MVMPECPVEKGASSNRATVAKYRREGAPAHIGYACAAIALGMPVWARAE